MPLTGACAWKELGIGPEERIDRFFNLIDHAVDNGVALSALYTRKHVKEFLLYTLHQSDSFCRTPSSPRTKDHDMTNITLTSTFPSTLVVGDPGHITITLPPKGTKTVAVNEAQLNFLKPQLEKLKAKTWLEYVIGDVAAPAAPVAPVVTAPVTTPVAPPPAAPVAAAATVIVPPVVESAPVPPPPEEKAADTVAEAAPEDAEAKKE